MRPTDDLCDAALLYRRIATRIRALEKQQQGGKVSEAVQERIDWWLWLAREAQRRHDAKGGRRP